MQSDCGVSSIGGGYGKSALIMSSSATNQTAKTSTEAKSNKKSSSTSKSKTKNSNTNSSSASGVGGGSGNGSSSNTGSKSKESAADSSNEKSTGGGGGGIFKPLVVLALPGVNLFRRFSQYRRLPQEPPKDKLEVELERLNNKIVSELLTFLGEKNPFSFFYVTPKVLETSSLKTCFFICKPKSMFFDPS